MFYRHTISGFMLSLYSYKINVLQNVYLYWGCYKVSKILARFLKGIIYIYCICAMLLTISFISQSSSGVIVEWNQGRVGCGCPHLLMAQIAMVTTMLSTTSVVTAAGQ